MSHFVKGQRVRVPLAYCPGEWEIREHLGTIVADIDGNTYTVVLDAPVLVSAKRKRRKFNLPYDLIEPLSLLELLAEAAQ